MVNRPVLSCNYAWRAIDWTCADCGLDVAASVEHSYGACMDRRLTRAEHDRDEARAALERVYRVIGNYGGKLDAPSSKIAQTVIDIVSEERADEERVTHSAEERGFERGVREAIRLLDHQRTIVPDTDDERAQGARHMLLNVAEIVRGELLPAPSDKPKALASVAAAIPIDAEDERIVDALLARHAQSSSAKPCAECRGKGTWFEGVEEINCLTCHGTGEDEPTAKTKNLARSRGTDNTTNGRKKEDE